MEGKRILIVEDEPRIALALCQALELPVRGLPQVEISPVAETALAKLQSRSYDLLITDLSMPGMGGIELLRSVHERWPDMCLMLITAFGSPDIEEVALRLGAAYLPKPFSLHDFVNTVERVLKTAPGKARPPADTGG